MRESVDILLVEDEPDDVRRVRELLADGLTSGTARLEHVERLDAAIDCVGRGHIDVVLLDLSLPDATGLDAFARLRQRCDLCPPVIVLSVDSDRASAADAIAAGAQDVLVKGTVTPELLVRCIDHALERHQGQVRLRDALRREQELVVRLQELDRLKNRFVAMASHELRTPLASISGFAATLRTRWTEIEDEDRLAYIRIIDEQGARLARLVDDLLVLSRIESGAIDARPETVQLGDAIDVVLAELDAVAPTVVVDVAREVHVVADRDHLEQMLVNYMSNAIKYGSSPISVESRPYGTDFIDVLVRDQGTGVPADIAPVLFEEFVRGRGHAAARIPGTGLGLSIVRGLARAQGGDAWHEPNLPNGAVFALRLPRYVG
jgi:signal transduction histidine kinase